MAFKVGSLFAALSVSIILLNLVNSSGFNSTVYGVSLNNTLNPGQPLAANQSPSSYWWTFAVQLNTSQNGQSAYSYVNGTQINYTDKLGRYISAAYPIQITGTPAVRNAFYEVNKSGMLPIQLMSSNVTLGSVYQGMPYQNATAAPDCAVNGDYYTEWDLYVNVQPSQQQGARNVVVARVCIYRWTIGYAEALPEAPKELPTANITIISNGQHDSLSLPYNSTSASAPDRLFTASWNGSYLSMAAPPNGSQYAIIADRNMTQWYVQTIGTYNKWYNQYYNFVLNNIPSPIARYSPSKLSFLSASCNVVSVTNLTNQSIRNAATCMNQTAALYYSFSNQVSPRLFNYSILIDNYTTTEVDYDGGVAIAVDIPSVFTSRPGMAFNVNGQLLSAELPTGAVSLVSVNASPIGIDGRGELRITLRNAGNTAGLFSVAVNGCPGISTEPGLSYQAGPGQEISITAPVSAPAANFTISRQCVVAVTTSGGGGEARNVTIASQTPNQFLHSSIRDIENALCNGGGILSQLACKYISSTISVIT